MIAAWVVQGAFAALMTPQILAVVQVSFPRSERPKALAMFGVAAATAGVLGPLAGGLLLKADVFVPVFWLFGRRQRFVPPELLRQWSFVGGLLSQVVLYYGLNGLFVVFAVVLQEGFGYSPLRAGLNFLPFSIGVPGWACWPRGSGAG
ncbi:MAG TPA: MFS transporter [Pseudonocardiaceae bacterium]